MARRISGKEVNGNEGKIDSGAAPGSAPDSDGELRKHGEIEYPDRCLDGNNQLESSDDMHLRTA